MMAEVPLCGLGGEVIRVLPGSLGTPTLGTRAIRKPPPHGEPCVGVLADSQVQPPGTSMSDEALRGLHPHDHLVATTRATLKNSIQRKPGRVQNHENGNEIIVVVLSH